MSGERERKLFQTEAELRSFQEFRTGPQAIHPPYPAQSMGEAVTFLMKSRRTFWSSQLKAVKSSGFPVGKSLSKLEMLPGRWVEAVRALCQPISCSSGFQGF